MSTTKDTVTGSQIASSAGQMVFVKLSEKSLGLVSTLILARLLTPADFGLVSMATMVVAFIELIGAFGFDTALIQRQDAQRHHYDTAWTCNALLGSAVAVILLLASPLVAGFYDETRLGPVLQVLALGSFIGGLENIGTVNFRKEMDFRKEMYFVLSKRVFYFVITIGLVLGFRSYWGLVGGAIAGKLISVALSYVLHPYRPRLSLEARHDLFHFSKWMLLSAIVQFLQQRSIHFILGRTLGSHGLGVYNVASELSQMPSSELIAPLNRAVYPAYAKVATDGAVLARRFLEVFGMICLLAFPVTIGMHAVADPLVRVLLGTQWLEAIPLVRIIALCGLASALQSNLYLVIIALGKPRLTTLLSGGLLLASLPFIIFTSLEHGAIGAAYAYLGTMVAGNFAIAILFTRITSIPISAICQVMWRPVLGSALMLTAVGHADSWWTEHVPSLPDIARLGAMIMAGATVYIIALLGLWTLCGFPQSAEHAVLTAAASRLKLWQARSA